MRRSSLLVVGSLVVAGAACWFLGRRARRERGDAAPAADMGGRREPDRELAAPPTKRKPAATAAAEGATEKADASGEDRADFLPAPTTFRLRVVNRADGTPVVGAIVERTSGEALGVSDAQGRLETEIVAPMYLDLRVHREGFVEWRQNVIGDRSREPVTAEDPRVWLVKFEPGAAVDGRVVLASGEPVSSAWIVFDCDHGPIWGFDSDESAELLAPQTDGTGRFHVEGLPWRRAITVSVEPPGRLPISRSLYLDGPQAELVLTIPDAGSVGGFVLDADGKPLGGVVVWLVDPEDSAPEFNKCEARRRGAAPGRALSEPWAVSKADGTYTIVGLPPEGARVPVARVSDSLSGRGEPVSFVASGDRQVREVRVPRAASLRVTLVGASASQSEDATLSVRSDFEFPEMVRESEGEPEAPAWISPPSSPGRYVVDISLPERPSIRREVELVAGERRELRVDLSGSVVISGVVVDANDRPVSGASVEWAGASTGSVDDRTRDDGTFRLVVWPGESGTVRVREIPSGPDFETPPHLDGVVRDVRPGTTDLRVVLAPAPRIIGRLGGWDPGKSSAKVRVRTPDGGGRDTHCSIARDGAFSISVPHPGAPLVIWFLAGGAFAPARLDLRALAAGETRDVGVMALAAGRELVVEVHGEAGKPVVGAGVRVNEGWKPFLRDDREPARTDAAGIVRIPHMPFAPVVVSISAEGHPVHATGLPVAPSGEPQVVTLGRGGRIDGRVIDASGKPAASEWVELFVDVGSSPDSDRRPSIGSERTDADGRFRFLIGPGSYRVAPSRDASSAGATVAVKADETRTVELRLK